MVERKTGASTLSGDGYDLGVEVRELASSCIYDVYATLRSWEPKGRFPLVVRPRVALSVQLVPLEWSRWTKS